MAGAPGRGCRRACCKARERGRSSVRGPLCRAGREPETRAWLPRGTARSGPRFLGFEPSREESETRGKLATTYKDSPAFPSGGREGHPLRRLGGSAPASRPAPRLARGVWWARAHPPSCLLQLGGRNQVPLPPSAVETAPALCGRFLDS